MLRYLVAKLPQYCLVVLVVLSLNFALPRMAPGHPIDYLLGEEVNLLSPEEQQEALRRFGLDRPVMEQYRLYLTGLVQGDLGRSVRSGQPVLTVLMERLPWTLLLTGGATLLSVLLGVAAGMAAAWQRGKKQDVGTPLSLVMFLDSMPPFWTAMLLVAVFSVSLGLLPAFGAVPIGHSGGHDYFGEVARRLVLPMTTLTLAYVGSVFLISRYSMLIALGQDYITMAEAKGVSEGGIVFRHALRNALLPVYTNVTLSLGTLLSGSVVVETVFSYPGLGQLIYQSVLVRDYNLLQGAFLLVAVGVVGANLLADLTYPLIDPRVRRPAGGG